VLHASSIRNLAHNTHTHAHTHNDTQPAPGRQVKWSTCALSEQPLAPPVVADRLGGLYNREAVLEWLLARRGAAVDAAAVHRFANQIRTGGAALEHLGSLKDVFGVELRPGGSGGGASASATSAAAAGASAAAVAAAGARDAAARPGGAAPPYACPITGLPCGRYTMLALVPCGHIISHRALERLGLGGGAAAQGSQQQQQQQCPVCSAAFNPAEDDMIIINGTEEQVQAQRVRMEGWKQRQSGKGKRKRDKAGKVAGAEQKQEDGLSGHEEKQQTRAAQHEPPAAQHSQHGKRLRIAAPENASAAGEKQ